MKRSAATGLAILGALVAGLGLWMNTRSGSRHATAGIPDDSRSIGGVVLNDGKPEVGVWVIADTDSLPTHYRRIVVSDDRGRFLVPDLPQGTYDLWVRGYGLRDSGRAAAVPGDRVTLIAANARSPQEAAQIYPANYWLSLFEPPAGDALPITVGEEQTSAAVPSPSPWSKMDEVGAQSAQSFPSRAHWIGDMKLGCMLCHQMGTDLTRLWTSREGWDAAWSRVPYMDTVAQGLRKETFKTSLVNWTSRIAAGETPPAPPRPEGLERNVVITQWTWARDDSYIHDSISTDKRNPSLYPFGPVWGLDHGQDILWALDPVTNTVTSYPVPTRNGWHDQKRMANASWKVYNWIANPHNPMMDEKGHVWITTQIRGPETPPTWAADVIAEAQGSQLPAASKETLARRIGGNRQLGYFDTQTRKFVLIDTLFATHHLQFDREGRVWTSGDFDALGMFDPTRFDPGRPEETESAAQKAWVKIDGATGKSTMGNGYGIVVNPADGTVWRASYPGIFGAPPLPNLVGNRIDKFDPRTRVYTQYPLPLPGYGARGIDASTDGKVWFATASGHLGRFDPQTERFTYWETPGPKIKSTGKETGSADFHYYLWVDQFDTLGLGKNIVIVNGTNSDSLLIFDPATEHITVIRTPYPRGMFTRGLDGRIDDPRAGWKGRGLWVSNNSDPLIMTETKMGFISHIQIRQSPLTP